jgi:hypothetical protein
MFEGVPAELKTEIFNKIESNLKGALYQNGGWFADYKRNRVVGVK